MAAGRRRRCACGVEQGLELGHLFQGGANLFLIGLGRKVMRWVGAMPPGGSGSSLRRLTSTSINRTRKRAPFKGRVVIGDSAPSFQPRIIPLAGAVFNLKFVHNDA
jgi:hypothetical protein